MKSQAAELLSIEFPIFAFSHCRDVVAAVSNAGGYGVLGAVAHTPEELDVDLTWIEEHAQDRPFGVDLLIPRKFAGAAQGGTDRSSLKAMIPDDHRAFLEHLLADFDIPPLEPRPKTEAGPVRDGYKRAGLQVDPVSMAPLIDVAFAHRTTMLASALGTPPAWLVDDAHSRGVKVAALAGTVEHAVAHAEAGVDLVIAQGTEAGGHTGEISTLVLVPQIVDAVRPIPVLAAGGIGNGRQMAAALALGADGVWCGSIWLTTQEAETSGAVRARMLAAQSQDTVRTRSFTGKPCRVLRSKWTDAWNEDGAPSPLPMPLQSMLSDRPRRRIEAMAERPGSRAVELLSPFVGQVVGQMTAVKPARQVVLEMVNEFVDAWQRVNDLLAD
ncbi:MAG: nitronate monooxygenase [Streptosporangiaceae bacterium]|jgi:NAD(P)H-dependent flavin oxidoreductase YrpB (nitropropane dioxygenase family)